ncbi:histone-lysine N-methyltransferase, putative [Eimeria praecox]|uniref:Histone-lysine N-methyltransferase, putative n=1 Tax=Eimeria praecox TaxID=51316 RepID=U6G1D9_9EIME|nr:histone-lysine N-methyltransferase, putative [Eimeria praecox]
MEASQRVSLRLPINSWNTGDPEAVSASSAAASASSVACAALAPLDGSSTATRMRKEAAPSKAKELIRQALLLRLPDRTTEASIGGNSAAVAAGSGISATCNSRASSANGASRHQWGSPHAAGPPGAHPSAAAAAATEAATGTMRHSPRAMQQQRLPSGAAPTNAALAAAKQRVLEKQQQLLNYLDCIAAGETLLRDIQQQQQRPKVPTALSRMMGVLPQQQQHIEELRQQRQRELMQLLRGRSKAQKKQNQRSLSKRQQQQQQRLRGTKRQLPTSALQLLYFRLQRKLEQLELLQDRQTCTRRKHHDSAELTPQHQENQREHQHQEQQEQVQEQQQCEQQLQQEQRTHLEQQQTQQQQQKGQAQRPGWRQQQQETAWLVAQQHKQEQHGFTGNTFLTFCEDSCSPAVPLATATHAVIADRDDADVTPAGVAAQAAASTTAAPANTAQACAEISPLPLGVEPTQGAAAAPLAPSATASDRIKRAAASPSAPTGVNATAAIGAATATSVGGSDGGSDAAADAAVPPLRLLEGPTPAVRSSCFSSRSSSKQSLEQLRSTDHQQEHQDRPAPQSLATARRHQLQELAASRTESLLHFQTVLEAAAARCDKLMAARDAFKEHVRSNGPRLRRNVMNGQASSKSLGVYKHRAAAAARRAEKLQVEEETAAAAEEQLQREAEALLPYKLFLLRISGVYGNPLALLKRLRCLKATRKELQQHNADILRKIEQSRAALVKFKKRALQEEETHLAILRSVFEELEATQMTADGLEAAAEEANSRQRDAAGALGLLLGLEKAAAAAAAAACAPQGAAERPGSPKQQPVQVTEYFLAHQQLLRLRDFIEKLEAVLQDLQEETKKQARRAISRQSPSGGTRFSSFASAGGIAVGAAAGSGGTPAVPQGSQPNSECKDIVEFPVNAMELPPPHSSTQPQQQQLQLELKQPPGFAALLQQPLLQPVYDAQQLQKLQQQGRSFAVAPLLHFFSAVPESHRYLQSVSINRDLLLQLQQQQQHQQQEVVPCPAGCGEAFCSMLCLDSDIVHRQLCVGRLSEEAPLVAFKHFAVEHCENLLLAAAAIVSAAAAAGAAPRRVASNDTEAAAAALQLLQQLLQHQHGHWQEEEEATSRDRAMEEETYEETEGETELSRKDIVERGSSLLLLGLREISEVYVHLISPHLVSELLSLFEHCNSDLEVANPLNAFFGFCLSQVQITGTQELQLLLAEKEAALAALFGEQREDEANSDEDTDQSPQARHGEAAATGEVQALRKLYLNKPLAFLCPPPLGKGREFPAVKQTAFFCSVARINHSCTPNMEMECKHTSRGGQMMLKLIRDVQEGEELCVSYLKDLPLSDRQLRRQRLEEFGFECSCHYCASGL